MHRREESQGRVRLGRAVYFPNSRRLVSAEGSEVYLRSQSANVLHFLVQRLGQLVSRDDLVTHVWQNVAVTDDSLTQCIRDVRKAIGDKQRSVLATVPKRGYSLKGVWEDERPAVLTGATAAQPAALDVGLGVEATNFASQKDEPASITAMLDPRDVLPTMAILPFKSDSSVEVDYFGIFLSDEIAKHLAMSEDVNVVSRLSTGTMGENTVAFGNVRQNLHADFALSGYLVRLGEQVSLSLEFADTETGYVLWSDRMQVPFDPTLPETEGLELVVANIRRVIVLNEERRVRSRSIGDLKLFSILHGAVGLMHRLALKDFKRAKGLLDVLCEKAPNHPAPWAWLARWHVLNATQGWADDARLDAQTALDHTARALDLDPNHTHALVCEGQVLMHLKRDLGTAEYRYDQALANNPNDTNARSLRGMLMAFSDRGNLGRRDTERALHLTALDPHRFMYLALAAGASIAAEDYERAVVLTKESLRMNRAHMSGRRMLPVAYLGVGDAEAASLAAKELMTLQPHFRVSEWLRSAPSADFENGRRFASMLRSLGVPD